MIILNQAWLFLQNVLKTKPEAFEVELFFSAKENKYFAVDFVYKPKWGEVSLGVWGRRAEKIRFFLFLDAIRLRHSLYPVSELRAKAKEFVCNGAGPKGLGWTVPDFKFTDAANIHDLMYTVGGDKSDKKWADCVFLWNMKRTGAKVLPYLYFWGVRTLGNGAFSYRCQKMTLKEINQSFSA